MNHLKSSIKILKYQNEKYKSIIENKLKNTKNLSLNELLHVLENKKYSNTNKIIYENDIKVLQE